MYVDTNNINLIHGTTIHSYTVAGSHLYFKSKPHTIYNVGVSENVHHYLLEWEKSTLTQNSRLKRQQ